MEYQAFFLFLAFHLVQGIPHWFLTSTESPRQRTRSVCPAISIQNVNECYSRVNSCTSGGDCNGGKKCCHDGCIRRCRKPILRRIDKKQSGKKTQRIFCSTSNFYNRGPMFCDHGYTCEIRRPADEKKGIPNLGRCVERITEKNPYQSVEHQVVEVCDYHGHIYKDGEFFFKKCNYCYCSNTVINCETKRCPTSNPKKTNRWKYGLGKVHPWSTNNYINDDR